MQKNYSSGNIIQVIFFVKYFVSNFAHNFLKSKILFHLNQFFFSELLNL